MDLEAKPGTYYNPIIPGLDSNPSIVCVEINEYYMVTSSSEYFPGIPIYHSRDLVNWELIGHVLSRKGYFYVISSSFDRSQPQLDDCVWPRGFYVKTAYIWNPNSWSEPIYFDQVGFHPDILLFTFCTVDLETGNSTSQPALFRGSFSGTAQGPHIIKHEEYYYLFTTDGLVESSRLGYVNRSKTGPSGPWELPGGRLLWCNGYENDVQITGHVDFFRDVWRRWWCVFSGVRPTLTASGRLETTGNIHCPNPMGGWLATHDDYGPYLSSVPTCPLANGTMTSPRAGCSWGGIENGTELDTPCKIDFSLKDNPNHLRLYGGPYTLPIPACPTMFLRKQIQKATTWETCLSFHPTSPRTEAGTVVWWNNLRYSSIGIRIRATKSNPNEFERILRFRPGVGGVVEHALEFRENDVVLVVECGEK
ncbi:hypothetical protein AJ79_02223 [Helicocarpus griseus UAMH5409]|uniref:Beta-xylosidase C-terminal Concanavalin A-like domain-containing protein n=1 Tax=Helicocarpus griseus UAMH5409 TaxID=1447875 RepID=A0A2B7Y304_9EURO|nr:hypothetical protein AJ79_02223 [Helicocarpus griseus UAMH5409]